MNWSDLKLRLRALLFPSRAEEDLDEVLRFHLAMQARKNLQAGMDDAAAKRDAGVQFGGLQRVKEECRDSRGLRFVETLAQDVRYSLRGLRRTPGFTITVIATVALGLGLNTTLFSFFNEYVLRTVSVRDPNQLYRFTWSNRAGEGHRFTWREYQNFEAANGAFSQVFAVQRVSFARVQGHLMLGQLVTGNYFQMLGVDAFLGRVLLPEDASAPGGAPVAVLSYAAWVNKFGSDPSILGKKLFLHGYPVDVVGVARPEFRGISEVPLDYWVPLTLSAQLEKGASLFGPAQPQRLDLIGRLRSDLTLKQAERALLAWSGQQTANAPDAEKAVRVVMRSQATILPLDPVIVAAFSPVIVAFGLVLVIACANVANMMLARAMSRQREMGVRLAMGAGRSRLVRQLLTESVLLALPASAASLLVSELSIQYGKRLLVATMPRGYLEFVELPQFQADARVFTFMLAVAGVAALLFGLAPALQATRPNIMQAARGEFTTDFRAGRLRDFLVIAQVTVSVLLLIFASVLLRANDRLGALDLGLRTRSVVQLNIQDGQRNRVLDEIASDPGVVAVAGASKVPLLGTLPRIAVRPEHASEVSLAGYLYASPEYFEMFQVPLLRGRSYNSVEAAAGAAVAVISQATANRYWPGRDAIGQSLLLDRSVQMRSSLSDPATGRPAYSSVRVIGIARDAVNGWLPDGPDQTCVYFPTTPRAPGTALFVHATGDAEAARGRLDAKLSIAVPGAVDQIHPMDEILSVQRYPFRALYWISSAVGGLALLLTVTGIFGMLSYVVTQRTKEIGIRVALGARPGAVSRLVLAQSLRFAMLGGAIGSAAAWAAIRLTASLIELPAFGTFDPVAFGLVLSMVLIAATAAAWIPARRAARVEPLTSLRCD